MHIHIIILCFFSHNYSFFYRFTGVKNLRKVYLYILLSDVGSLLLSKNLFLTGYFEAELIFNFVENEMNVDSGSKDSGDIFIY